MLDWLFGSKLNKTDADKLPSYEVSRGIAAKGSVEKRRSLASLKGLQPEFLYYFATDKEPSVRQAVAANISTPLQADKILTEDANDDVRAELAIKISKLLPGINTARADKVTEMVLEIIHVLAKDKTARIRAIVSEEIKSLDNVPENLVKKLARDAEAIVSMPVLEYSPLLSDLQLMEIIRSGIDGGALAAIARRNKLSKEVSTAVIDENIVRATIDLLRNKTVSISEDCYHAIAASAEKSSDVLENLIDRDDLTMSTIRRISSFVGNAVLSKIIERNKNQLDVNEEAFRDIRQKVADRIKKGGADNVAIPGEESRERAEKLYSDDNLTEDVIIKAIKDGERMFIIHSLALLAGISWKSVRDIINSKSAKTIAALSWKTGLSAKNALFLQSSFCSISKPDLAHPDANGDYSFSEDDMEWYLDSFS